jgi:hypothetical protein
MGTRRLQPKPARRASRRGRRRSSAAPKSIAIWSLTLATLLFSSALAAQTRPDAPGAATQGAEPSGRIIEQTGRPGRFDENIQHGFFGDLSRRAPPALNRIEGIRIPGAANPQSGDPAAKAMLKPPRDQATPALPTIGVSPPQSIEPMPDGGPKQAPQPADESPAAGALLGAKEANRPAGAAD